MFMYRGMREEKGPYTCVVWDLLTIFDFLKLQVPNDTPPRRLTEDVTLFYLLSLPSLRGQLNIIQRCASSYWQIRIFSSER